MKIHCFDFQTANAKFNKQELAREAVSGSPLGEAPNGDAPETPEPEDGAYNKTKSFQVRVNLVVVLDLYWIKKTGK